MCVYQGLSLSRQVVRQRNTQLLVLRPHVHDGNRHILLRKLCLRGGEAAPASRPETLHVIAVGTVCGAILILNEMNLVSFFDYDSIISKCSMGFGDVI